MNRIKQSQAFNLYTDIYHPHKQMQRPNIHTHRNNV